MENYYVNKNTDKNGNHEVHRASCQYVPTEANRLELGRHPNCKPAVAIAKTIYPNVDGCYFCSRECHLR